MTADTHDPIRRAVAADAGAIAGVHVASWRETYVGIVPDATLAALSVPSRAAMWSRILGEPAAFAAAAAFVAEQDGTIVGFGSCGLQRTESLRTKGYEGEFHALYVLRSHQGRGLGQAMMQAMFRDLGGRRITAASLWVLRRNRDARQFYERIGGTVIGEKEDVRGADVLIEVAYGWRDLSALGA